MPNTEKFDDPFEVPSAPSFEGPGYYGEEEYNESFLDSFRENTFPFLQDNWKKIALILVLLTGVFLAYYFFIGNNVDVSFRVLNTEGRLIGAVQGDILSEGNIVKSFFGGAVDLKLPPGTYEVRFKPNPIYDTTSTEFFEVFSGNNEQRVNIILEKKYDLTFASFNFPSQLFLGESKTMEIARIKNNDSQKDTRIDYYLSGDLNSIFEYAEFYPDQLFLPKTGEAIPLTMNFKVDETRTVSNKVNGEVIEGRFIIRYLKKSNEINQDIQVTLYPAPEISLSPSSLRFGRIKAGSDSFKNLTVSNNSKFSVDVNLSLETDSTVNGDSEVLTWLEWESCSNSSGKVCNITIAPASQKSMRLNLNPSLQALEENISGEIIANVFGVEERSDISFTVEEVEISIEADLRRTSFTVNKLETGDFESKRTDFTIENTGDVSVSNIIYEIRECPESWARIVESNEFPISLDTRETTSYEREFQLEVTAPRIANPNETKDCSILLRYDDPVTGSREELNPIYFSITAAGN